MNKKLYFLGYVMFFIYQTDTQAIDYFPTYIDIFVLDLF